MPETSCQEAAFISKVGGDLPNTPQNIHTVCFGKGKQTALAKQEGGGQLPAPAWQWLAACSMARVFLLLLSLEINTIEVAAEDLSALCGDSGEGARGEAVPGAGAAALLCEELGCPVAHEGCCR